jgi:hypothetical protein
VVFERRREVHGRRRKKSLRKRYWIRPLASGRRRRRAGCWRAVLGSGGCSSFSLAFDQLILIRTFIARSLMRSAGSKGLFHHSLTIVLQKAKSTLLIRVPPLGDILLALCTLGTQPTNFVPAERAACAPKLRFVRMGEGSLPYLNQSKGNGISLFPTVGSHTQTRLTIQTTG